MNVGVEIRAVGRQTARRLAALTPGVVLLVLRRLVEVASRLVNAAHGRGLAARLGGDEFAMYRAKAAGKNRVEAA